MTSSKDTEKRWTHGPKLGSSCHIRGAPTVCKARGTSGPRRATLGRPATGLGTGQGSESREHALALGTQEPRAGSMGT